MDKPLKIFITYSHANTVVKDRRPHRNTDATVESKPKST